MKRMTMILVSALLTIFLTIPAFAADTVRLAYVEWDCSTASTNTIKAVLEEAGYEVEILPVAAAAMWQAVGSGDVEGMVSAWLPVTHGDYLKRVQKNVEDLGPTMVGAKVGWAVPTYVTINSVDELNANADKFDGRIIGIDPGAGLMRLSEETIEAYGIDNMELVEGSGATMTASLAGAIKDNKWAVVTAWSPHWMFGRWDLKYLEDPKGTLGASESINTIVRKDLKDDMPGVYAIMKRFSWKNPAQLQMVMAWNQEADADPYENAKRFLKENPDMLAKWLGK